MTPAESNRHYAARALFWAAMSAAGALLVATVITEHRRPAQEPAQRTQSHALPGGLVVHELVLSDGTRCLASSAGGVACEWLWMEPGAVAFDDPDEPASAPAR